MGRPQHLAIILKAKTFHPHGDPAQGRAHFPDRETESQVLSSQCWIGFWAEAILLSNEAHSAEPAPGVLSAGRAHGLCA